MAHDTNKVAHPVLSAFAESLSGELGITDALHRLRPGSYHPGFGFYDDSGLSLTILPNLAANAALQWPDPWGARICEANGPKDRMEHRSFARSGELRADYWFTHIESTDEQLTQVDVSFTHSGATHQLRLVSNSSDFWKGVAPNGDDLPEGVTIERIVATICTFVGTPALAEWRIETT